MFAVLKDFAKLDLTNSEAFNACSEFSETAEFPKRTLCCGARLFILGTFHSIKNYETLVKEANGTEIFSENPRIPEIQTQWEFWIRKFVLFLEIPENAVSFYTGNVGNFLLEWKSLHTFRFTSTLRRATLVILMARRPKFKLHFVSFTSPREGAMQICRSKF